jgi:peptidyl-prolyl cis-trans isomerase-like 1
MTNATMQTNQGTIELQLFDEDAPKTVENFKKLAQDGFYNGIIFHRVIPDFMVQGGDPTGTGRGGESCWGGTFADEIDPSLKHSGAGILSMANAGPDSNGSQFFITLAPTPWLDGKHAIFGRVKKGMKVVRALGAVRTGLEDKPVEKVGILRATLAKEDEDEGEAQ